MDSRSELLYLWISRGIATGGAFFITHQHQGLPYEIVTPLREAGHVVEQRVRIYDAAGHAHLLRRLHVKLKQLTRDGVRRLSILTNLPRNTVSALTVARLYRQRWIIETVFQELEGHFHSEINTLGYPKAALFGFCLALVAYNLVAAVLAALEAVLKT